MNRISMKKVGYTTCIAVLICIASGAASVVIDSPTSSINQLSNKRWSHIGNFHELKPGSGSVYLKFDKKNASGGWDDYWTGYENYQYPETAGSWNEQTIENTHAVGKYRARAWGYNTSYQMVTADNVEFDCVDPS
jgi:hypothetical protein